MCGLKRMAAQHTSSVRQHQDLNLLNTDISDLKRDLVEISQKMGSYVERVFKDSEIKLSIRKVIYAA